jgi:hypothetical protein
MDVFLPFVLIDVTAINIRSTRDDIDDVVIGKLSGLSTNLKTGMRLRNVLVSRHLD